MTCTPPVLEAIRVAPQPPLKSGVAIVEDALELAANEAMQEQEALDAALGRVLRAGALDPALDEALASARRRRDAAAARLGFAVLALLRVGEPVVLEAAREEAAHGAEPEKDAPTDERGEAPSAPVAPQPPPEPAPPVSQGDIHRLKASFTLRPGFGDAARAPCDAHLDGLLDEIALLPPLRGPAEVHVEVDHLDSLSLRLDPLRRAPQDDQQRAIAMLACRCRRVQDEACPSVHDNQRLDRVFARLSQWSDRHRPGWVLGLARQHRPKRGSWQADAVYWQHRLRPPPARSAEGEARTLLEQLQDDLDTGRVGEELLPQRLSAIVQQGMPSNDPELLDLAEPHLSLLERTGTCKTLRSRLKERIAVADATEQVTAQSVPDAAVAAAARAATAGRHAVIVGGDERGQARQRIEQAFGFATLEWERGWNTRKVQALRERIANGSVDCVVFLRRFLNHKLSDLLVPTAREAGVLMVWVDQGYGVTAVERAVLKALGEDGA